MREILEGIRCFDCGDKLEIIKTDKDRYQYTICINYKCRRVHEKDGIPFIEKGAAFYCIGEKLVEKKDSAMRCILCGGLTEDTKIRLLGIAKAIRCIKCGRLFQKNDECLLPLFITEEPLENDYKRDASKDRPAYYDDYLKTERETGRVYLETYKGLQKEY
jgi:hypothetical protein